MLSQKSKDDIALPFITCSRKPSLGQTNSQLCRKDSSASAGKQRGKSQLLEKKHKIKKTVSPKLSVSSQKRQLRFARNEIKGNKQIPIHRPKILQTNMGIVRTFLRQTLSSHQVCCNDRCTATNTRKEGCKNPSDLSKHKNWKAITNQAAVDNFWAFIGQVTRKTIFILLCTTRRLRNP